MKIKKSTINYFLYFIFGVGYAYIVQYINTHTFNFTGANLIIFAGLIGIPIYIQARKLFKVR